MLLADDDLGKARRVRDALDDGGRAAGCVAGDVDVFNIGLKGGTLLRVQLDAVGREQGVVDLLADGGDNEVAGDLDCLARGNGASSAGGVRLTQLHLVTDQLAGLVYVHVSNIRKKLDALSAPVAIKFVRNAGYILEATV